MKNSIYIAGPMTGKAEYNYPAFTAAANRWRKLGWKVFNPAENFGGATDREYRAYIREDLAQILQADAIGLLPGWSESKGARFELHLAQLLKLDVYDATTLESIEPSPIYTVASTYEGVVK